MTVKFILQGLRQGSQEQREDKIRSAFGRKKSDLKLGHPGTGDFAQKQPRAREHFSKNMRSGKTHYTSKIFSSTEKRIQYAVFFLL